jgi:hypothetical protein
MSTTGTAGSLTTIAGRPPAGTAPRLRDRVAEQLDDVVRLAAPGDDTSNRVRTVFNILTRDSLDRPATPPFGGLSFINADGLPFQWVFRFDGGSLGWGFLCEVGRAGTSTLSRHTRTLRCTDQACVAAGGVAPAFLDAISQRLIPETGDWPPHWRSASWVGVGIKGNAVQIKPYFNLNRGSPRDRWLRAGWVLHDLGRTKALERLCALSALCSRDSWPTGLAVDVRHDGNPGRIKIYFRSGAVTTDWLARWYDAAGLNAHAPNVRRVLDLLGRHGRGPYPPSAFVISLECHADERISLKTDLAVTKWMAGDARIVEAAAALLCSLRQPSNGLTDALRAIGINTPVRDSCRDMRFIGLGCEPDGTSHVNVYVAPPLRNTEPPAPPRRVVGDAEAIRAAIDSGIRFLTASCGERHWHDFSLPVGASDAWVTAYVLAKLAELPGDYRDCLLDQIHDALDWLADVRTAGSGWGYHGDVPNDADSTAWAIRALRAWRRSVARDALGFLESCVHDGGGVATYPRPMSPAPGWDQPMPDVTAAAMAVLPRHRRAAALAYCARWAAADGLIPAYWWASPLYTCAMLPACSALPRAVVTGLWQTLIALQPDGSFERALLLRCRLSLGLPSRALAHALTAEQNGDGSWAGSALLRLSRPDVAEPWSAIDSGPVYPDQCGIFTTATAVAALGRALPGARADA